MDKQGVLKAGVLVVGLAAPLAAPGLRPQAETGTVYDDGAGYALACMGHSGAVFHDASGLAALSRAADGGFYVAAYDHRDLRQGPDRLWFATAAVVLDARNLGRPAGAADVKRARGYIGSYRRNCLGTPKAG